MRRPLAYIGCPSSQRFTVAWKRAKSVQITWRSRLVAVSRTSVQSATALEATKAATRTALCRSFVGLWPWPGDSPPCRDFTNPLGAGLVAATGSSPRASRRWLESRWLWCVLATATATIPFAQGFSASRVFYVRDLEPLFWGRFLWLRRTLLSGEWPLWDPYIGGGQSAVADALHQMFLLPVLAIRLIGPEVVSFNLWVLLPFPVAAAGAWLFLARRFSVSAAALGAIAFAVSGPVVSTGNFP